MAAFDPPEQRKRIASLVIGVGILALTILKSRQRKLKKVIETTKVEYLNNPNEKYNYSVDYKSNQRDADLKHVAQVIYLPWKNVPQEEIQIKIVCGGITNLLFRLTYQNKSLLVRIYGENTETIIDRVKDNWTYAELSKMGFSPIYYGQFSNGRIEQWFQDARPLQPEEMGQEVPIDFCSLVAIEIARMHLLPFPSSRSPCLWNLIECVSSIASTISFDRVEEKVALQELNLQKIKSEVEWLKTKLPSAANGDGEALLDCLAVDNTTKEAYAFAGDVVFAHNDLLSGNMMYNEEWERIRIIDYEYSGYNYRGFDLANHFCEYCGFDSNFDKSYPTYSQQMHFFRVYLSRSAPALLANLDQRNETDKFLDALYTAVNRFSLASHLFWCIWSIVQNLGQWWGGSIKQTLALFDERSE